MGDVKYTEHDEVGLDTIGPLWEELNRFHGSLPSSFSHKFAEYGYDRRKAGLLKKAAEGKIRVFVSHDNGTGEPVGYCVVTISEDIGEIESLYVSEAYRSSGVGDELMKRAVGWLNGRGITYKRLGVVAGNEDAFEFYKRHNFYPRTTILVEADNPKAD